MYTSYDIKLTLYKKLLKSDNNMHLLELKQSKKSQKKTPLNCSNDVLA